MADRPPVHDQAREALAQAFAGVIHNSHEPDYWAADLALDTLDALLSQPDQRCPACDGKGEVETPHPSGYEEWGTILAKCRRCDGTGSVPGQPNIGAVPLVWRELKAAVARAERAEERLRSVKRVVFELVSDNMIRDFESISALRAVLGDWELSD